MALEYTVLEGNPFLENTYVLYDETKECIIIDPGCSSSNEEQQLKRTIESKELKPVRLINTHCHIDHVLGNRWVNRYYSLLPEYHELERMVMSNNERVSQMYGVPYSPSPVAKNYLNVEDTIEFGNTSLEIRFTPGHSPGSLCFIDHASKTVIGGDVLFYRSIGRTDLPGGDHKTLLDSIKRELYSLPDDYVVLPGHGRPTRIGEEKRENPFITQG